MTNKSSIIYAVTLSFNLLAELCFPFILVATVFGIRNHAVMLTAVVLELVFILATATVANITAVFNSAKRWYTVALPTVAFIVPWLIFLMNDTSNLADFWILIVADLVVFAVCLTSFLISRHKCIRKQNKGKNETIQL